MHLVLAKSYCKDIVQLHLCCHVDNSAVYNALYIQYLPVEIMKKLQIITHTRDDSAAASHVYSCSIIAPL